MYRTGSSYLDAKRECEPYTSAHFSDAIDRLVDAERRDGETVAKAHVRLAEDSATYQAVFRGLANAPIEPLSFVAPERPVAKMSSAEHELERLTKSIQQPAESHAAAYSRALSTEQGRHLYAELANTGPVTVGQA